MCCKVVLGIRLARTRSAGPQRERPGRGDAFDNPINLLYFVLRQRHTETIRQATWPRILLHLDSAMYRDHILRCLETRRIELMRV